MKHITRTTQLTILPEGQPIFCDAAIHVRIEDEAGGEFISIKQINDSSEVGEIRLDVGEWPEVSTAIDRMLSEIKQHEKKGDKTK